jgi:serpin B
LSPYSVAVTLAMTANGARGDTARRMLEALHVESLATYNAGMAALGRHLDALAGTVQVYGKSQEVELSTANQLFGDRSVTWDRGFLTVLAKQYGAGVRSADFRNDPETARTLINQWASDRTHGRITEVLPQDAVDALTRLVLVDALYFKAPWATPFDRDSTVPGRFTRSDGTTVTVPLMTTDEGPTYVEGAHFRSARLPYAGGGLAMTVALPTPGAESAAVAELLTSDLRRPGRSGLVLVMPRWTYRVATNLKSPLTELGMGPADADFGGMTSDARLHIDDVLHQTYVAVDEAGTEAAAVTAAVMGDTSMPVSQERLVLDRAFLYLIHDVRHGTPLFLGRVADPGSG